MTDRREVLKLLSGLLGGGAATAVAGPTLTALLAPLGKVTVTGKGQFLPVAAFDSLPADGAPLRVPVVVEAPRDAWAVLPPTEVGAVFLRRVKDGVVAYSSVCPHLGCGVVADGRRFFCPCHDSAFGEDGQILSGPSPRGLDALETRVEDGRVFVKFEQFATGRPEKVVV